MICICSLMWSMYQNQPQSIISIIENDEILLYCSNTDIRDEQAISKLKLFIERHSKVTQYFAIQIPAYRITSCKHVINT